MSLMQILGADGNNKPVKSVFGDALPVSQIGAKFLEWARKGYIYVGSVGTAAELPKYDDVTNIPTLWNKADSGKIVIPLRLNVGFLTAATEIIHGLALSYKANAGSMLATAAPFSAFTEVAAVSTLLGSNKAAVTKWSPATNIQTAASAFLMMLDMGLWTEGTADGTAPYNNMHYDFDGSLIMLPGTSICIGANVAGSTAVNTSIVFAELPYNPADFA